MILAVANQKGGTCKTSTAWSLACAGAHKGLSVLAVDLDPQANLSYFLKADTAQPGAYAILEGKGAVLQHVAPSLDAISASWSLQNVTRGGGSARRLATALEGLRDRYNLIVIDTPPTAGELQVNALMACDRVLFPLSADVVSLQGLYAMIDTAHQVQTVNTRLQISGYILTKYSARSTLARQMADTIENKALSMDVRHLADIPQAVALQEAQALRQSLYDYAPTSKPAVAYMALLEAIMEQ